MKQTAVEWLEDYINKEINKYSKQPMDLNAIHALNHIKHYACNQAKEMEKQQLLNAWYNGSTDGATICTQHNDKPAEQYYNATFKQE